MSNIPTDRPMTPQEFMEADEPYCFMMSVNPVTGESNYEYMEGWEWAGYYESIKEDFPERFHTFRRNKPAKKLWLEAVGIK